MYPISFDNPNDRPNGRAARTLRATTAGNGSPSDTHAGNPGAEPNLTDRLLVVECRTDDRWRVVLCTGMIDLDDALDTVRQLKSAPDVDEVCLSIEVSGHQGRESRREVLRLNKDQQSTSQATPVQAPEPATSPVDAMDEMDAAIAAVAPALKLDISYDDMILPAQESRTVTTQTPEPEPTVRRPAATDETSLLSAAWKDTVETPIKKTGPLLDDDDSGDSDGIPEFLKALPKDEVYDISLDTPETDGSEPKKGNLYDLDAFASRRRTSQSLTSPGNGWIDDMLNHQDAIDPSHTRGRGDSTYNRDEDDDDGFSDGQGAPMFVRENGATAKVLVFAGTVALLVLGGALAELLAVDITTAANAGSYFLN